MGPVAVAIKHQRGPLGKARRKRLRATIGLLRDRLIASNAGYSKPHTATEMDIRLCEFVQHSWEEGDSRNIPTDARYGLIHFIDAPRGQLHASQRLLRAWSKNELPMRADPLPINRNAAFDRFSRSLENQ